MNINNGIQKLGENQNSYAHSIEEETELNTDDEIEVQSFDKLLCYNNALFPHKRLPCLGPLGALKVGGKGGKFGPFTFHFSFRNNSYKKIGAGIFSSCDSHNKHTHRHAFK